MVRQPDRDKIKTRIRKYTCIVTRNNSYHEERSIDAADNVTNASVRIFRPKREGTELNRQTAKNKYTA